MPLSDTFKKAYCAVFSENMSALKTFTLAATFFLAPYTAVTHMAITDMSEETTPLGNQQREILEKQLSNMRAIEKQKNDNADALNNLQQQLIVHPDAAELNARKEEIAGVQMKLEGELLQKQQRFKDTVLFSTELSEKQAYTLYRDYRGAFGRGGYKTLDSGAMDQEFGRMQECQAEYLPQTIRLDSSTAATIDACMDESSEERVATSFVLGGFGSAFGAIGLFWGLSGLGRTFRRQAENKKSQDPATDTIRLTVKVGKPQT